MFANFYFLCKINSKASTDIFLDTRRIKRDNTYPLKLRITFHRKTRFYNTDISLNETDFDAAMKADKPRGEFKGIKFDLMNIEDKAMDIIEKLPQFSFPLFEKRYFGPTYNKTDLFSKYKEYIAVLEKNDQIGTASAYTSSKKSLYKFLEKYHNLKTESFPFSEISQPLLKEYENYMLKEEKLSYSTIGIYLRPLRTLFNMAREEGDIPMDHYPFGKRKYQRCNHPVLLLCLFWSGRH